MENGVDPGKAQGASATVVRAKNQLGAIALAEGRICDHLLVADVELRLSDEANAFGGRVTVEHGNAGALASRLEALAAEGQRAALIGTAAILGTARGTLRTIAARRLPAVAHAISDRGSAEALGLADLGWGVLFASSVEDSLDMSLIARRAAEDCGTPFFVVHERSHAAHVEPLAAPTTELCEVFVGPAASRIRRVTDPAHPSHANVSERAFAERVPFALGSAMRELESLTGRRHDVLERIPATDTQVVMVAMGEIGETLFGEVERLRAQGHDVGAVKLSAFRPFPGPRLVKVLSRAAVISVIETVDQPLAQSNPLTREIKAAFADALTWAPDYPGVGRIPRVVSGVAHTGTHEIEAHDIDAILHNMLKGDDRSKRSFVFSEDPAHALEGAPSSIAGAVATAPRGFVMRGRVGDAQVADACAELCASLVHSAFGLRARGSTRPTSGADGEGFTFDVVASREGRRGSHPPHALRVVALGDTAVLLKGNPIARLGDGGVLAIPSAHRTAEGVWGELPPYAKAIVFDRGARVIGFAPPPADAPTVDAPWLAAATFAGIALACVAPSGSRALEPSLVAREVHAALQLALGASREALVSRGATLARAAFEASVEVPRATIEKDEESVRLGRRDARAAR